MPIHEVKVPPMGESISSGIMAKWHVSDGDIVAKDQPLYELETDKITSEGTADFAGKISLEVEAGAEVKIGQVIALIDESGDKTQGETRKADAAAGQEVRPPKTETVASGVQSPAVRRLAEETGIDPAAVAGTGKAGRVTKGDMLAAAEARPEAKLPAGAAKPPAGPNAEPAPTAAEVAAGSGPASQPPASADASFSAPATAGDRQTRRKMSPLRQRIAQRLLAAQHDAAMLTTFNEADMSAVIGLRSKYQDDFVKKYGIKIGFTSFVVKAVVQALREIPAVNVQIEGDTIVENHYYDIGVAVSTEKGLMVPVIRDCDQLGLAGIEKAIAGAAKKAREAKISLADLEGGVFTITNGGVFGSMLSTPILNPPQSGILGLHSITERPAAVGGQVVIRPMMYLALSYDHRAVDGKEAVTFLVKVKQVIEDPSRLLLGL